MMTGKDVRTPPRVGGEPPNNFSRIRHVAYINTKTDVPDWLGAAGKTHMNQLPYAATIAKTLVSMAHKIPSYHGQGFALDPTPSSTTNQKTATEYVDEFLIHRRKAVEADPNLRITDRLTQRGVAYRLRPEMMIYCCYRFQRKKMLRNYSLA